ncbi:hypothetical protein WYY_06399 [Bacillus velezensis M27]|uniref:Uncharacterized protein n=1 Tax=Bacillus amyloliquefaciens (strain Y2) TaxID=1155777 RepID=I2C8T6_BACAY|nr:hypothetical protein MUS_3175 [Bacillus velezensis YAU B9601-Y2]AFZ91703.1 hypothetical protein B938_13465 [Bacillus velezensis AS43.3]AGF26700.1 hypothetical protein KSO_006015 [Bacillus amyloliquefaciens IT-45]AGZ57404.1 hypothetical protein U471_27060 [Bacillus amyloliquefaciens CC178]AHC43202.1 hypothetical protein U722_14115 [Bacillus amyloliquefaciens LFB112]AMQ75074.1 hypothetical protein BAMY6614_17440 [Bacillus amyloliquefaciens UMAF6614]ANF37620.1 hypothetical protein BCBMB205_27
MGEPIDRPYLFYFTKKMLKEKAMLFFYIRKGASASKRVMAFSA